MIPSLFTFTILTSLVLLAAGLPLLVAPSAIHRPLLALPRNYPLGVLTMLLGGGWFLWKITQLGQADFGDYKNLLFALFAATLVGCIFYVKDFLAIRGLSVLVLLSANAGLKSAYGEYDIPQRLGLVFVLYVAIVVAIYMGIAPYAARNWLNWLYADLKRLRILGTGLTITGLILGILALTY